MIITHLIYHMALQGGLLDTVGAVCVDSSGYVASAVSSGGLLLKHTGRVGQAAVYGCGCWAENNCEGRCPSRLALGCQSTFCLGCLVFSHNYLFVYAINTLVTFASFQNLLSNMGLLLGCSFTFMI